MKLFFYVPDDPTMLYPWYIAEVLVLFINYALIIIWVIITPKVRVHIHLKIYIQFVYVCFAFFITARLVVLAYFFGFFTLVDEVSVEKNTVMIVCAVGRMLYPAVMVTITFIIAIDRELALYFIQDYECTIRLWIPICLIILSFSIGLLTPVMGIYEIISFVPGVIAGALVIGSGFLLYLSNFYRTWKLNHALKKRLPCRLKYSLNARYQLEENIWFSEMMTTAQIVVGSAVVVTSIIFFLSNLPLLTNETREGLDLAYHLLMAIDAPVIAAGLFFGTEVEPDKDDGDFYFDQLLVQWEGPETKKIYMHFVYGCFVFFITARLIVLAYFFGIFSLGDDIPVDNTVMIACAVGRMLYLVVLVTITFIIAIERELALYFIQDYECTLRLWIPIFLIFLSFFIGLITPILGIYEIVTFVPGVITGVIIIFLGLLLYLSNFSRTWRLNHALKKRLPCRLKYSLSTRYQLEENIWFSEVMTIMQLVVGCALAVTTLIFFLSNLPFLDSGTREALDLAYHLLIAIDAPIIAAGTVIHNKYMVGIFKRLFFKVEVKPDKDDGDFYFDQLLVQWEGLETNSIQMRSNSNRTLLMRLVCLKE